jgi:hypothetical protein
MNSDVLWAGFLLGLKLGVLYRSCVFTLWLSDIAFRRLERSLSK